MFSSIFKITPKFQFSVARLSPVICRVSSVPSDGVGAFEMQGDELLVPVSYVNETPALQCHLAKTHAATMRGRTANLETSRCKTTIGSSLFRSFP